MNAAARVGGLNNGLGTDLLVTDPAFEHLPDDLQMLLRSAGEHAVKGRAQPVRVWTPVNPGRHDGPTSAVTERP